MTSWSTIGDTIIWLIIALVFFVVGYRVLDWITPFNLSKEIDDGNVAAGIAVAGLFVAMGMIVTALVQ